MYAESKGGSCSQVFLDLITVSLTPLPPWKLGNGTKSVLRYFEEQPEMSKDGDGFCPCLPQGGERVCTKIPPFFNGKSSQNFGVLV